MIRFLLLFFLCSSPSFAQIFTSTIRGSVKDADTGLPLANASVRLVTDSLATNTNEQGTFRFDDVAIGRYVLTVSYLGYESVAIPEILLESGKEIVQQIGLNAIGTQLKEAVVTSSRPPSFNSVQAITI